MTQSEYREKEASLAFQLATHQAFGSALVVVGMSLNDEFLLKHLARYHNELEGIYWVSTPTEVAATGPGRLAGAGIEPVLAHHSDFWNLIGKLGTIDDASVAAAWYLVVEEAAEECKGGVYTDLMGIARIVDDEDLLEKSRREAEYYGEPGEERLLAGAIGPAQVQVKLRELMRANGWPVPITRRINMSVDI